MNSLFVAARAVHYASALLLFGELVFVIAVARPAWRRVKAGDGDAVYRRLFAVARWSVIASIASGAAWLAAQAAVMSGVQAAQAMNRETLGLVLGNTVFGHVWVLRLGLIVVLVAVLLALRRSAGDPRRSRLAIVATVIAAAYLGSLAWAGHAVAGAEPDDFDQHRCRCRASARRRRVAGRAAGARGLALMAPTRSTRWRRRRGVFEPGYGKRRCAGRKRSYQRLVSGRRCSRR